MAGFYTYIAALEITVRWVRLYVTEVFVKNNLKPGDAYSALACLGIH